MTDMEPTITIAMTQIFAAMAEEMDETSLECAAANIETMSGDHDLFVNMAGILRQYADERAEVDAR
jgi:hypothetical protein